MSLHVVGINHRTAPVDVRERVVFEPLRLSDALRELLGLPHVSEAVIVSTCNRTELYCVVDGASGEVDLGGWLQRYHGLGAGIQDSLYRLDERTAVAHTFARRGRSRLDGARRAADPGPAQGRLSRGAGDRQHRTGAQPPVPGGVLGGQARADRDGHRRQRGVGRVRGGVDDPHRVRRSRATHRAADRCRRHRRARRPSPARRWSAPHDHRQPQHRRGTPARGGVPGLRHRARGHRRASSRGGHRPRLDREPDPDRHPRDGRGCAGGAAPPPDTDPRHRRAPRHRSGGGEARGRVPVHDRRSAVGRRRQPRGPPPGRAGRGHPDRRGSCPVRSNAAHTRCGVRRSGGCATRRIVPAGRRSNRPSACSRTVSRRARSWSSSQRRSPTG